MAEQEQEVGQGAPEEVQEVPERPVGLGRIGATGRKVVRMEVVIQGEAQLFDGALLTSADVESVNAAFPPPVPKLDPKGRAIRNSDLVAAEDACSHNRLAGRAALVVALGDNPEAFEPSVLAALRGQRGSAQREAIRVAAAAISESWNEEALRMVAEQRRVQATVPEELRRAMRELARPFAATKVPEG